MQDNISTSPELGLGTTAGSYALKGSVLRRNADIVERVGGMFGSFKTKLIVCVAACNWDHRPWEGQLVGESSLLQIIQASAKTR